MIAELLLIGKLLGETDLSKSTPPPVVRPKFFQRPTKQTTPITLGKPKTIAESFKDLPPITDVTTIRPPSKFTGDVFLKKYF